MQETLRFIHKYHPGVIGGHDNVQYCQDLSNARTTLIEWHSQVFPSCVRVVRPNYDLDLVVGERLDRYLLDLRKNLTQQFRVQLKKPRGIGM